MKNNPWKPIKENLPIAAMILLHLLLRSIFVMLLWNSVIPDLFLLKSLTFLQAMQITVLAYILFGSVD